MNLYAVNETPINGWATLYGTGNPAAVSLSAIGDGTAVRVATGLSSIALQSIGNGTRVVMGSGTASIAISAEGVATYCRAGKGNSQISLQANGKGLAARANRGASTIELRSAGWGRTQQTWSGAGASAIRIQTPAKARTTTPHLGRSVSQLWLNAYGEGRLVLHNTGGHAQVEIKATGDGRSTERVYGAGTARIALTCLRAESRQYREVYGSGVATIALAATTRGNRIITLPSETYPAPHARSLRLSEERRIIRVAHDARITEAAEAA